MRSLTVVRSISVDASTLTSRASVASRALGRCCVLAELAIRSRSSAAPQKQRSGDRHAVGVGPIGPIGSAAIRPPETDACMRAPVVRVDVFHHRPAEWRCSSISRCDHSIVELPSEGRRRAELSGTMVRQVRRPGREDMRDERAAAQEAPPAAARGAVPGRRAGPLRAGRGAAAGRAGGGGAGGRFWASGGGGRAAGVGRRSRPGCGWIGSAGRDADRRQEPGRAPGGAGDRGRAGAGDRRGRGAGARLAGDPQPLPRGDRDQRQDDHGRAARARLPDRRRAGRGRRQRRHAALLAGRRGRPRRDRRLRGLQLPARGQRRLRARVRRLPQPRARPPRPPRRPRRLPGGEAADLRQPGQRRRRRLQRRRPGAGRRRPRRLRPPGRLLPRRRARLRGRRSPRGRSSTTASRCSRSTSSACSASTTSPTRWPPPPRRSRWASTATRCARGCAASPASRTGSSRSPRSAASASSTTPRRPTSPRPRSACAPSRAASTRSSAAARRASRSRRSLDPVRERCAACYLIGASADRLAAELAPVVEAGVELHRCADLEDAVRRAAAAARPGEVVLLSPACASFDAFENFEAARRALPRDRRGAAMSARALDPRPSGQAAQGEEDEEALARRRACRPSTTCCSPRPSACSPSAR